MTFYHIATFVALAAVPLRAQTHEHAAPAPAASANEGLHMRMSATRAPTRDDSLKAMHVASELRVALKPFQDTSAATAAGYKMFMPGLKDQKVFHFTNNMHGLKEGFRFDPTQPTSLLYKKDTSGNFVLVGAMYTAPKRFSEDKLDARVPVSIAQWHQHINWCLPKKGDSARWLERRDGAPLFGPESAITTESACKAVGGDFNENIFGWMLHANVFAGDKLADIFGDEHAAHDMHAGMKM